jgi:hypothetical protein
MTVSSVDTAELPRVAAVPVVAPSAPAFDRPPTALVDLPVLDLPSIVDFPAPVADIPVSDVAVADVAVADLPVASPADPVVISPADSVVAVPVDSPAPLDRLALRAERRQQRRQRRLYAGLGLSVMASTLAATIVVLDVVR